jgi:hypothetical protein
MGNWKNLPQHGKPKPSPQFKMLKHFTEKNLRRRHAHCHLRALKPTETELEDAARWAMTHDVSEGFRMVLIELLNQMGYESAAKSI